VGQEHRALQAQVHGLALGELDVVQCAAIAAEADEAVAARLALAPVDRDPGPPKDLDRRERVVVAVDEQQRQAVPLDGRDEVLGVGLVAGDGDVAGRENERQVGGASLQQGREAAQGRGAAVQVGQAERFRLSPSPSVCRPRSLWHPQGAGGQLQTPDFVLRCALAR
jgi:hypothetical protein